MKTILFVLFFIQGLLFPKPDKTWRVAAVPDWQMRYVFPVLKAVHRLTGWYPHLLARYQQEEDYIEEELMHLREMTAELLQQELDLPTPPTPIWKGTHIAVRYPVDIPMHIVDVIDKDSMHSNTGMQIKDGESYMSKDVYDAIYKHTMGGYWCEECQRYGTSPECINHHFVRPGVPDYPEVKSVNYGFGSVEVILKQDSTIIRLWDIVQHANHDGMKYMGYDPMKCSLTFDCSKR